MKEFFHNRWDFLRKALVAGTCGGMLGTIIFTQTELTLNQSPSLGYKAFFCLKGLKPTREDFVSIHNHPNAYFEGIHFTKRLKGLPGDSIEIQTNKIFVAGNYVGELKSSTFNGKPLHSLQTKVIPDGYVFVSADHPSSFDSRYEEFGLVKQEHVFGRCVGLFKFKGEG